MKNQFRNYYFLDIWQPIIIGCIMLYSLLFVHSATVIVDDAYYSLFYKKQIFSIIAGLFIYGATLKIQHKTFIKYASIGCCMLIGILSFTLLKGSMGLGARRWLDIGLFRFQPSELSKICFPPLISYVTSQHEPITLHTKLFLYTLITISFVLIAKQPDLGTALLCFMSSMSMLLLYNMCTFRSLFGIILIITMLYPITWSLLKPYQKKRILVFLGYGNEKKEAYQKEQALIAIGSGGITGKGLLHGSQNKLQFLPEGRTDFIFAVIAEEIGFIGVIFLLFLYCVLFFRLALGILAIHNMHMQILAFGLIAPIMFSTVINISMVLGLAPIVGIPLPLVSYGITHMWISLIGLGFFQNITMQRLYRIN